jgi:hypothetical protein
MEIALGAIVVLLFVIAVLLWDILKSLNRLEDVVPAARDLLQVVERKERRERVGAYLTDNVIEQQHTEAFDGEPPADVLEPQPAPTTPRLSIAYGLGIVVGKIMRR